MFDKLSERLERSFKILKGEGRITEINVAETVKDIRKALLEADVNYKVAKSITDAIKNKALGQNVLTAVKPGQLLTKIVRDELALLMGGENRDINLAGSPNIIMVSGLQGAGKTTFCGKLAVYLKEKKGRNVLLVGADIYRPAAIEQLRVLADGIETAMYSNDSQNAENIVESAIKEAKLKGYNTIIVDTAGRLAIDDVMMKEITNLKKRFKPEETLFVVDAMTGQDAVNTAKAFDEALNFDGVVLTKMDGDSRGGAAISIRSVVNKPLKFISSGEKMYDLHPFHPERMADRILGMGDVVSLVEKAQEVFSEQEARDIKKKIAHNQFNLNDYLKQISQLKKMGNLKDMASMIPGVGKMLKGVELEDDMFKNIEVMLSSMTNTEREKPEIINASRKNRIAKGSGKTLQELNHFLKQFESTRKMMRMASTPDGKRQMMGMMKNIKK